jgi:hypothetical protein
MTRQRLPDAVLAYFRKEGSRGAKMQAAAMTPATKSPCHEGQSRRCPRQDEEKAGERREASIDQRAGVINAGLRLGSKCARNLRARNDRRLGNRMTLRRRSSAWTTGVARVVQGVAREV